MRENGRKSSSQWADNFKSNFGAIMRKLFFPLAAAFGVIASAAVANEPSLIGVVNFNSCMMDSKCGKKEQENLESIRKQLSTLMEDTEKEMREIAGKFEDTEYLDSLSPKAEEELKAKFQSLQEDMGRYQNQFYQVLNSAQYQMMQKMNANISKASEKIAKQKKLDYVMNKDACYFIRPDFEITTLVISEMDKAFDLESQKKVSENADGAAPMDPVDDAKFNKAG